MAVQGGRILTGAEIWRLFGGVLWNRVRMLYVCVVVPSWILTKKNPECIKYLKNIILKSNLKDLSVTQAPKYKTILWILKRCIINMICGTFTNGLHARFKLNESPIYSVSVFMVLNTIKLQNMWFNLSDLISLYISFLYLNIFLLVSFIH